MHLVIRTAHGSADVDLESYDVDTTLADLIAHVTGLAVPTVVSIDGRPCRVDITIVEAISSVELAIGSVIDVGADRLHDAAVDHQADPPVVRLRQLTGRGTGEVVDLPLGRYRFGAGRRLADDELQRSTVEEEAFSIAVTARPTSDTPEHPSSQAGEPTEIVEVTVRPGANVSGELGPFTPTHGGQLFDRELPWFAERLSVGGRVFDLVPPPLGHRPPGGTIGEARIGPPDDQGARSFDAAGSLAALHDDESTPTLPTIAALERIAAPTRMLWRRTPDDDRLATPIGLDAEHREPIVVDFVRHRGVAVAGTAEFTAAMARTMLVELTTALGPGDLDLFLVASAGRLGSWDWTKWLPHLRGGDPAGALQYLTSDADVADWLETHEALSEPPSTPTMLPVPTASPPGGAGAGLLPPPAGRPHARPTDDATMRRTLLIVDDASHWTRRDSPIRELLLDPPRGTLVLATVDRIGDAPGACTAVIDEIRPDEAFDVSDGSAAATRLFGSLCRFVERMGAGPVESTDVRPALTQTGTATRIARSMASYDDLRVRHDGDLPVAKPVDRPSLGDVIAVERPAGGAVSSLTVPIGTRVGALDPKQRAAGTPLGWNDVEAVDLRRAKTTVLAAHHPDAAHALGALTLGAAAHNRPDRLAILLVGEEEPEWVTPLPHLIGTIDANDTEQVGRVIRRVAAALAADPDFELLVTIDGAVTSSPPYRLHDATAAFAELAQSLDRVHLIMSTGTEHAEMVRRHLGGQCGAFITAHGDGHATLAQHAEGLNTGSAVIMPSVDLVLPTAHAAPPPAPTVGLRVVPFVHGRPLTPIERRLERASHITTIADRGDTTDPDEQRASRLLPPPFPDRVGQETLLPGPGERSASNLPLGIVDRADGPGFDVYRWAPASGSLLAVGNRRSGAQTLADLVAVGLVDADAEAWVLDPLPQRRRAFRRLPNCVRTIDPDSAVAVLGFLDEVEARVDLVASGLGDSSDASAQLASAVRGGPRPVVIVIADVDRTLAAFDDDGAAQVTERLRSIIAPSSERTAPASGAPTISIVGAASRRRLIEPLLDHVADVLVGDLADAERRRFGVPDRTVVAQPGSGDPIAGRCWSVTRQRLVQLATPPDAPERFIRERIGQLVEHDDASDQPDDLADRHGAQR